jgi:hypothetical protein
MTQPFRSIAILALLAGLLLLCAGCGANSNGRSSGAPHPPALSGTGETIAEIHGTVVDALTGVAVAGASVEGPAGTRATSDEDGRFQLTGLPVGAEGELVARTKGGAEARNRLRPLRAGTLEVVLRVRKP